MKTIELVLVIAAAAGLTIWRGVALYRTGLRRRNL